MSSSTGSSTNINHQVQVALEEYQRAYDRMEELRTILPGVRIVSPPSSNINVKQQQEHEMAAQQFLGILPYKDDNEDDEVKQRTNRTILSDDSSGINEEFPLSSMMIRNILLVFVAITQIALFLFLIGTDPMMQSSLSSNIHETTSIWPWPVHKNARFNSCSYYVTVPFNMMNKIVSMYDRKNNDSMTLSYIAVFRVACGMHNLDVGVET